MKPRVLIVSSDERHHAALPAKVEGRSAFLAREALEMLTAEREPFWVLVADVTLQDSDGVRFLAATRERFPDAIRILAGRFDGPTVALTAINEARVFAALADPVSPDELRAKIIDGIDAYRRAAVSKQIGAHEHAGIVQIVTGMFSPVHRVPELPPASVHLRERVRVTARLCRLPNDTDLEMAAMLSLVGLAAVPSYVHEKLRSHARLSEDEAAFLDEIPAVGLRLLETLPKIEGIAAILRLQGGDPTAVRAHPDGRREPVVPMASRILRAVVDLQVHEDAGMKPDAAVAALKRVSQRYDRQVLRALEGLCAENSPASNPRFAPRLIEDLVVGSSLATDAVSFAGVALVAARSVITPAILLRLHKFAEIGELVEPLYVDRRSEEDAREKLEAEARAAKPKA